MSRRVLTAREQHEMLFPWRQAVRIEKPENIAVHSHSGKEAHQLADEVRNQGGPKTVHDLLRNVDLGDDEQRIYLARDPQGTIHGVLAAYDDGMDMDITDVHASLKAPRGTGTALLHAIASDALNAGRRLNVKHVMDRSRNYWQQMGSNIPEGEIDGTWSPEAHRALVDGNTIPAPFTKVYDDDRNLIDPMDSPRSQINRADRLPGSIR